MFGYLTGFDNDLFESFERMRRQMDELFGEGSRPAGIRSVAAGTFPAINVGASPQQVEVDIYAAGLDPASLEVTLQQNLLTVAGERQAEPPQEAQLFRNERFSGSFRRVLSLPEDVDPEQVDATYRDGVLHITVRRREAVQPRRITIH